MIKRYHFKQFIFPLILFACCSIFFSCKSTPTNTEEIQEENDSMIRGSVLSVPKKKEKVYFSSINKDIIGDIQKGTIESLKDAASKLKKGNQDYTNDELILLNIIDFLLSSMYQNESLSFSIPAVTEPNEYSIVIDSAKKGVYDANQDTQDFFLLTLPSLVLFITPSVTSFYPEVESNLQIALQMQENSYFVSYLLASLYQKQNKIQNSIMYYEKAYKIDNSYILLAENYALMLAKSGKTKEAYDIATQLLQRYPDSENALRICAETCFNTGDIDNAEQYVIKLLQRNPEKGDYLLLRARILMEKQDYIKVNSLLGLYTKNNKEDKSYLILKSQLQRKWNKNNTAAATTLLDALTSYPNDFEVLLESAKLASETDVKVGNETAQDLISRLLQQNPTNQEALFLNVCELMKSQQWQKAYDISSSLIQSGFIDLTIQQNHIILCINLDKLVEARESFDSISQKGLDNDTKILLEIQLLIAENQYSLALEKIKEGVKTTDNKTKSSLYYEKSRIASSDDEQLADLRLSLTSNPRNEDSLYALYQYYFKKADYHKSQYYIKQVVALNPNDTRLLKLNEELDILLAR